MGRQLLIPGDRVAYTASSDMQGTITAVETAPFHSAPEYVYVRWDTPWAGLHSVRESVIFLQRVSESQNHRRTAA